MCKCVLPPGVNPIAVDKYIKLGNIQISGGHQSVFMDEWSINKVL
jgi:hypothetical protein